MTPTRYIVIEHDGQWKINHDNRYYGPFPNREAAVETAIDTARRAGASGHDAMVMEMTGPALFATIWRYRDEVAGG